MTTSTSIFDYIWQKLRPYRRTVLGLMFVAIIAALFDTVIPIVYGRALDVVIQHGTVQTVLMLLGTWLVLRMVTDWLRREISQRGGNINIEVTRSMDTESFNHLLGLPLPYHINNKSGEFRERINNFRFGIDGLMNRGLFDLGPAMLTVLLITGYLFSLDWRLGLVNMSVISIFILASGQMIPELDEAWEDREAIQRKFYGRMWDAIQNVGIIKANSAEVYERRELVPITRKLAERLRSILGLFRKNSARQDTIFGIGTIALFGVTALGISNGVLSPGQLATVLGYAFLTWGMVRQYLWVRWDYVSLDVYRRKYEAFLNEPEEAYGIGKKMKLTGAVAFEHVRFRYREEKSVLEDVSFNVNPGEVVAIVGESGEGKTTIMELLSRYYTPQRGTIHVDGTPIDKIELTSLRSQIAYVPQDLTLFHATLQQNIRFGRLGATDRDVEQAAKLAALHAWAKRLPDGYKTVVGERGLKLSAGERQRVALARAFLRNPTILILDEPTSNLDASTEAVIQQSLHTLMKGRTTFIIAHRLRTVHEADRIVVLQGGRIVEQGTHAELMQTGGTYQRLHDLQFKEAVVPETD